MAVRLVTLAVSAIISLWSVSSFAEGIPEPDGKYLSDSRIAEIMQTKDIRNLARAAVKPGSNSHYNGYDFLYDKALTQKLADAYIAMVYSASGKNVAFTSMIDKGHWQRSSIGDAWWALVTEDNAFARKREEKALGKALDSLEGSYEKIIGAQFVVPVPIQSYYDFNFDLMSKTFVGGRVGRAEECYFYHQGVAPLSYMPEQNPMSAYAPSKITYRGAGYGTNIDFQIPEEGTLTELLSVPQGYDQCAFTANFDGPGRAEQFEEILSSGSVLYYTATITDLFTPEHVTAEIQAVELYSVDDAGNVSETPFNWTVTRSAGAVETLSYLANIESSSDGDAQQYAALVGEDIIFEGYSSDHYAQFKDGGQRLFVAINREGLGEYELRTEDGASYYQLVRAKGAGPETIPPRIFMPAERGARIDGTSFNLYKAGDRNGVNDMRLGFRQKLRGDLASQF